MNIFHCLTRRALVKNRTRTLVTIIGITLSMALFTAVIQGAHSGLDYLGAQRNRIGGRVPRLLPVPYGFRAQRA